MISQTGLVFTAALILSLLTHKKELPRDFFHLSLETSPKHKVLSVHTQARQTLIISANQTHFKFSIARLATRDNQPTMADAIAEATAKLHLDEETGEMVSKGELKKRLAKRAKKASKEANKAAAPAPTAKKEPTVKKPKPEEATLDPDAMFKEGFLARVYEERPTGKDTVTRFPPEPNGLYVMHTIFVVDSKESANRVAN